MCTQSVIIKSAMCVGFKFEHATCLFAGYTSSMSARMVSANSCDQSCGCASGLRMLARPRLFHSGHCDFLPCEV